MSSVFISRLLRLCILLFFQVLVCNNIHLLVVCFHRNTSRISILLWGFAIGLLYDIFSNTAGMASASCTLIAMCQPALLGIFTPHDAAEDFTPTMETLGFWNYTFYVLLLMLMLNGAFYLRSSSSA